MEFNRGSNCTRMNRLRSSMISGNRSSAITCWVSFDFMIRMLMNSFKRVALKWSKKVVCATCSCAFWESDSVLVLVDFDDLGGGDGGDGWTATSWPSSFGMFVYKMAKSKTDNGKTSEAANQLILVGWPVLVTHLNSFWIWELIVWTIVNSESFWPRMTD